MPLANDVEKGTHHGRSMLSPLVLSPGNFLPVHVPIVEERSSAWNLHAQLDSVDLAQTPLYITCPFFLVI